MKHNGRILVVDDEPGIRSSLTEILTDEGYAVESVESGEVCNNTGYKGRVALYEVMVINDDMRELILSGASSYDLRQKAVQNGMISLRESGLRKIRDGITTLEEVARETLE